MAVIVTASNVLVQFRYGDWLTWGRLRLSLCLPGHRCRQPGCRAPRGQAGGGGRLLHRRAVLACRLADRGRIRPAGDVADCHRFGSCLPGLAVARRGACSTACEAADGGGHRWCRPSSARPSTPRCSLPLHFRLPWSGLSPGSMSPGPMRPYRCSGPVRWRRSGSALASADLAVKLSISLLALIPFRLATLRIAGSPG